MNLTPSSLVQHVMERNIAESMMGAEPGMQRSARSASPVLLEAAEVERMRSKASEFSSTTTPETNAREKELVDMVLRLTDAIPVPDTSQLLRQAHTIAELTRQRDYLVRQAEDERSRWSVEREGWGRSAEMLLKRRRDETATYKELELEHHVNHLDSANKSLRDLLTEAQSRLRAVQSELHDLRPVLLMQSGSFARDAQANPEVAAASDGTAIPTRSSTVDGLTTHSTPRAKLSGGVGKNHYRRLDGPSASSSNAPAGKRNGNAQRPAAKSGGRGTPLLSDARAEHLLLAARRLGRLRAGRVLAATTQPGATAAATVAPAASLPQSMAVEVDIVPSTATLRRSARAPAGPTPRTPRRTQNGVSDATSSSIPAPTASTPAHSRQLPPSAPPSGLPADVGPDLASHYPTPATPRLHQPPPEGRGPGTPIDSILTAAQSIMGGGSRAPAAAKGKARVAASTNAGSPVAKRRKVAASTTKAVAAAPSRRTRAATTKAPPGGGVSATESRGTVADATTNANRNASGLGRVRSALDVLADQAAMSQLSASEREASDPRSSSAGAAESSDSTPRPAGSGWLDGALAGARTEEERADRFHQLFGIRPATPPTEDYPTDASLMQMFLVDPDAVDDAGSTDAACEPDPDVFSVTPAPGVDASSAQPAQEERVRRPRSSYVKWTKDEDDLLAQAVAKHGPKWDLVSKALPARGYHQVRQRWLRKLGAFDNKQDLSAFQTAASFFPSVLGTAAAVPGTDGAALTLAANPKLGLAPLSMEMGFSSLT